MELWEFIERYVYKNTILRIWSANEDGTKQLLWDGHQEWCMEWQILNDECYQSKYKHCKIIGVTASQQLSHSVSVTPIILQCLYLDW